MQRHRTTVLAALTGLSLLAVGAVGSPARAATAPDLGTAGTFAVLAASTVTNTGPSTVNGDLGVSPGTAITGFGPGTVVGGTIHSADAVALTAQADLTTAYNAVAGQAPTAQVTADLGGQSLVPGVYAGPTLSLTGALTLNAGGNPDAVFVFQSSSTLITASASSVLLVGSANPCNVFWQVGSSATLGSTSTFAGSVLALTSITADTGATVQGRLLARNGAVTLHSNAVTRARCAAPPVIPTASPTTSPTAGPTAGPTASPTTSSTTTPTASPTTSSTTTPTAGPTASPTAGPTASPSTPAPSTPPAATPPITAPTGTPPAGGPAPGPGAPGPQPQPSGTGGPPLGSEGAPTVGAPGTSSGQTGGPTTSVEGSGIPGSPEVTGLPRTGTSVATLVHWAVLLVVMGLLVLRSGRPTTTR